MSGEQPKTEDGSKILSELAAENRYLFAEIRSLWNRIFQLESERTQALFEAQRADIRQDVQLGQLRHHLGQLQELVFGTNLVE